MCPQISTNMSSQYYMHLVVVRGGGIPTANPILQVGSDHPLSSCRLITYLFVILFYCTIIEELFID